MNQFYVLIAITTVSGVVGYSLYKHFSSSKSSGFGRHTTALDVVRAFGQGKYLSGKTAIVTGGNSGIGLETCKALASAGCRVILCSRSVKAGLKAIDDEIKCPGEGGYVVDDVSNIVVKALDLSELSSVKAFCEDILATESRIDYLICNAGIMALPKIEFTSAGFERQIGVNHFGHAYLYFQLEEFLKKQSIPCRVVILASTAHTMGDVVVDDLHFKRGRKYSGWTAYGQSKLANILFAKGIADSSRGTGVTAVSVHPGVIKTHLWRSTGVASGIFSYFASIFIMDKTIPEGASTTLWGCLAPGLDTDTARGSYLVDCAPMLPNQAGQDNSGALRRALWDVTKEQLQEAISRMK